MDGGCLLMAKAIEASLKGNIFVIVNSKNKAEHAVFCLEDGAFLDADGIHHSSENLLNWFYIQENIKEPLFLRPYEKNDLTQANQRVTSERIEYLSQIIKKWKNIFLEQKTNNTLKRLKN